MDKIDVEKLRVILAQQKGKMSEEQRLELAFDMHSIVIPHVSKLEWLHQCNFYQQQQQLVQSHVTSATFNVSICHICGKQEMCLIIQAGSNFALCEEHLQEKLETLRTRKITGDHV